MSISITMKVFKSINALFTCFLVPALFSNADGKYVSVYDVFDEISDRLQCPDPVEFSEEYDIPLSCVESTIPPWPLCLLHNVTYFIEAAVSSASRCCDFENLDECRCPLKEKEQWQMAMEGWCEDIATCPMEWKGSALSTEAWVYSMMEEVCLSPYLILCDAMFSKRIHRNYFQILHSADGRR